MSYRQNIYKYEEIYTISMDNIFLNQFNSTNNFFDGTISDIKNYVDGILKIWSPFFSISA